jgi:SAM-dependent methyltransferase
MSIDFKEYWNNKYWKKFLGEKRSEDLDFLSDLWINKYIEVFDKIPRGKTIDLGCGLGQYTKYLMDKGFDVLSCDISAEVLKGLKENITNAKTLELDMSKPLPFNDNSFNLVFANLSIHYFDTNTTIELLREIRRILTPEGYFVGSVNSTQTYQFIKDIAVEIEPNYYEENGRHARLFDREQMEYFFKNFDVVVLEEVTTRRWDRPKIMWEFITRPHSK